MAKKNFPTNKSKIVSKSKSAARPARTEVRNTAVPRVATPAAKTPKKEITREMIAIRAYEIFASGKGGSEHDNWLRAERELRA